MPTARSNSTCPPSPYSYVVDAAEPVESCAPSADCDGCGGSGADDDDDESGSDIIMTRVDGLSATTSFTTAIDITGSQPLVTDGVEILTTDYTAQESNRLIKLQFICPYLTISSTGPVVAVIFVGPTPVGVAVAYVTTGDNFGSQLMVTGIFTSTSGPHTISVRMGPQSAAHTVSINPASNDFGGLSTPFLLIEESAA